MNGQTSAMTRRCFLARCTTASTAALISSHVTFEAAEQELAPDWAAMLEDPVRKTFSGPPDLDRILALFPRTQGPPAFDPQQIAENVAGLQTSPTVNTGHPFLDLSVKTGLAHIDATFHGDHPKYGVGAYAQELHDGFPPTIIAAVDAPSAWGLHERAAQLFRYWLVTFVQDDGSLRYYGPSMSEYGQLLHTAALLEERAGTEGWWSEGFPALDRIAECLLRLRAAAARQESLLFGAPEADTRKDTGRYFHNNGWAVKGLHALGRSVRTALGSSHNRGRHRAQCRAGSGGRHAAGDSENVARRSGRLVAAATGRASAEAGSADRSLGRRVLHQLPLLAGTLVERSVAVEPGKPRGRGAPERRRAVLRHDAVCRPSGRLAAGGIPVRALVAGSQE